MNKKERNKKIKELEERSYKGIFEYADIIGELDKLLEEDPEDIEVLNFKADMLSQLGHKEEAKLIHAKVLSLNFKDKEALEEFLGAECSKQQLSTLAGVGIVVSIIVANILFFVAINNMQVPEVVYGNAFILPVVSFVMCPVVIALLNCVLALKNCEKKMPGFIQSYFKNVFISDDVFMAIALIVSLAVGLGTASFLKNTYYLPYSGALGFVAGVAVYALCIYLTLKAMNGAKKKKNKKNVKKKVAKK